MSYSSTLLRKIASMKVSNAYVYLTSVLGYTWQEAKDIIEESSDWLQAPLVLMALQEPPPNTTVSHMVH